MTIDNAALFDQIEALAAAGPSRNALLEGKNIRAIAIMRRAAPDRYAALFTKLRSWTPNITTLRAGVEALLKKSEVQNAERKASAELEQRLEDARASGRSMIVAGEPVTIAKDFVEAERPRLLFVGDDWMDYTGTHYAVLHPMDVRSALQRWMDNGVDAESGEDYAPTRREIDDVMDGLKNHCYRNRDSLKPPSWLETDSTEPNAKDVISLANGLLDVRTGELMPHTWTFYTRTGLEHPYLEPWLCDAPREWLTFLNSLWPGEIGEVNIPALQEIMGHLLTTDTKYQKIFMLVGPRRSGKGTIAKTIGALIGPGNIVEQSLNKLGKEFGMASMVGKSLLLVPDARLERNANYGAITETLLNISGQDGIAVAVKFKEDWRGRLDTKILLIGNLDIALPDQSGALNGRYVPLTMTKSFYNHEDLTLFEKKLTPELPAILNWALEGLNRLEARGHFVLTPGGEALLRDIGRKASPVMSFLSECCEVGPEHAYSRKKLFRAFEGWVAEQGSKNSGSLEHFTKELNTVNRIITLRREPITNGKRAWIYNGVLLRPEFEAYKWPTDFEDDEEDEA